MIPSLQHLNHDPQPERIDPRHQDLIGALTNDPAVIGSLRGFLLLQTLCSISKTYEERLGCVDWTVWKAAFDFAVNEPSNPDADRPPWLRYYYIFISNHGPDAYLQDIQEKADLLPRQTDNEQRRLALFWKYQVKRIILQRLIFGGEINDASKAAYGGNLLPRMSTLLLQTEIFLGRKNGSVKNIVDIFLKWHAVLKKQYPDFPKVGVDVAIDVFQMAVELGYDEIWNKHKAKVPDVIRTLREKWVQ